MRLFVAWLLDDPVRRALQNLQDRLRSRCPGVRWTPPDQVHLTVKFLGEVPDDRVSEVCDAVSRAAAAAEPFALHVGGCGCFPEREREREAVRIVWAGAADPTGRMASAVESVEAELEPAGFPREGRPWSAHITIGRVREDRSRGALRSAVSAASLAEMVQHVASFTLMSSVLGRNGPSYAPVHTAALGGNNPL